MTAAFDMPTEQKMRRVTPLSEPVSFEQFIEWYPNNSMHRYELRGGVIFQMPRPKGQHSELAGFMTQQLGHAIRDTASPYIVPRGCTFRASDNTGYEPDVIVLDSAALAVEPLWQRASTVEKDTSIKLIVEVVADDWQDEYDVKFAAYEALGVSEYWVVDYAGLGGFQHMSGPKQPALMACRLLEGKYEITKLQAEETVESLALSGVIMPVCKILGL